MKKHLITLFSAIAVSMTAMAQFEYAPAFPGAEGHGRFTTGARASSSPTIVHVTNLNDSGTGSFRAAVTGGNNRIIVFDVAGVIALKSNLSFKSNLTILGQTAPSPGITLRYYTVDPGPNNIVRFIRFRRGQEKDVNDGADASTQRKQTSGFILDHCSFSWSIDEVASFYDNNDFTMQWCTIAESLVNAGHEKGAHGYGGIWGGKLASFHHNMIAHVANRGPRFNGARYRWTGFTSNRFYSQYQWKNYVEAENVDFRNCVMWDAPGTCYGGPGGGQVNIVNNYYRAGNNGRGSQERVTTVSFGASGNSTDGDMLDMTSRYYISGNTTHTEAGVIKENRDWNGISYDNQTYVKNGYVYSKDPSNYYTTVQHDTINGMPCVRIKMDEPCPKGYVTTHTAATAFDKVLAYVGASLYRDEVDERYVSEAKNGTCTYTGSTTGTLGLIDIVSDCNGYTEDNFPTGSRESGFDTDQDGMPDEWETRYGLNPNDKSDALTKTLDTKGYYTNLEVYANQLVEDIMKAGQADGDNAFEEYYPVLTETGIETLTSETAAKGDTNCYNLAGQRVSSSARGIIIQNGKKIIR